MLYNRQVKKMQFKGYHHLYFPRHLYGIQRWEEAVKKKDFHEENHWHLVVSGLDLQRNRPDVGYVPFRRREMSMSC